MLAAAVAFASVNLNVPRWVPALASGDPVSACKRRDGVPARLEC